MIQESGVIHTTDEELAENYEQNAETITAWIAAARKELKDLDPDGPDAKDKRRLISGLAAQKKQLLGDAERLRGGPAVGIRGNRARGGKSEPPRLL